MTYEEFVKKGTTFYMDMVRLIDIKLNNRMEMTSEEKEINGYILQFQEETKINELRDKFQKCLELEE
jgi:hypothetical protein|tara:strand:+ start:786 stop:986 length:201 start_codon:yes stop_codon:yes gene_type:complete